MEKLYKNKYALGVYGKNDELLIMAFSVKELSDAMKSKLQVVKKIVSVLFNSGEIEGNIVINHKKYTLTLIDMEEDV